MNKTSLALGFLTAMTAMGCAVEVSESMAELEPGELDTVTAALEVADSELIDQEAEAPMQTSANGAPATFCGWPPVCPRGMRVVHAGCDARCYVVYGHDCSWGYNRVDCVVQPPEANITAAPQTVTVATGTLGTTRICWNTQSLNYPVWIRVSVNGGPGQLFTKESDSGSACENAPWIQAGNSYEFRIHDDNLDASPVYTAVTVTGVPGGDLPPPPPGACERRGGGACPPGQGCQCGESFCTPTNQPCP